MKLLITIPSGCGVLIPATGALLDALTSIDVVGVSTYTNALKPSRESLEIRVVSDEAAKEASEIDSLQETIRELREQLDQVRKQP